MSKKLGANHIWASGVIFYASGFWKQLNDEQKAVFQQASRKGAAYFNQLIVEDEAKSVEQSLKSGGKVLEPEAFEEWQKGAQGVWRDFAGVVGGIDRIKAIQTA